MSRLTWVGSIALVLLAAAPALRSQNCSVWNTTFSPQSNSGIDWTQHGTGDHTGSAAFSGSCSYSGSVAGSPCQVYCQSTYTAAANDSGLITNPFKYHVANYGGVTGQATSNGPQVSCGAEVAVAAHSCIVLLGCDLTVTISGSVDGIGGSVGYSASTIWSPAVWKYQNTCAAEKAPYPSCLGNCSVNCVPPNCGPYDAWNPTLCSCEVQVTPIIIDTDGKGFHLTSAANGVTFDFFGNGHPFLLSWTEAGSTNGWLALDRNGNGRIDSAKELFGNITDQPPSKTPNGYRALAVFDSPDHGGNGDGVIDAKDAVWPKLLVWIDANHDGISQKNELHSLEEVGIQQIRLGYTLAPFTDTFGNRFRYKGSLKPFLDEDVDRVIYDVFLVPAVASGNQ